MSQNSGDLRKAIEGFGFPELPESWRWATIGELGEVRLGRQRSPKNRSNKFSTKYIRAANLTWNGLDMSDVLDMEFTPNERETYRLRTGDVVLAEASGSPGEVGKPAVWNDELDLCCFQNTVIRFRPSVPTPKFAYFVFSHYARNGIFTRSGKGVGIHHLSAARFSTIPFPVAPEAEQRRIVAKIEELFSDLDAGVAALARAKANLKRYRAAVLKAAVEGKLTANESPAFQEQNWRTIDDAIDELGQGWSPKCEQVPSDSHEVWGVIKTSAVMPMEYIQAENKRLPESLKPRPHLEVEANDVLITRAGPRKRAAVTCMVRVTRPRLIVCDKVYRLRCNATVAAPGFIELVLNAPQIADALDELKTGISDSGVNLTQNKFRKLRIPLPDLATQQSVIDEVNRLVSIADESEKVIARSLKRAARLRQSILKRAFEGKLVPQDSTDEPASNLLELISAEREPLKTAGAPSKPRKQTTRGRK